MHLLDRSMCAAIGMRYGGDAVNELAVEEWRGASPVYGKRLREIMNVEGDDIAAIFKVLQLDPGFPHHYMDVRYEVVDEHHGYFELAHCGALMDAEPWGERMVTGMCHHIEDGTFDDTAQAVNPKARIRPVHRPPRVPPTACRTAGGRWSSTTTPRRCPRPTSPGSPPAPRRPPSGSRRCATARRTSRAPAAPYMTLPCADATGTDRDGTPRRPPRPPAGASPPSRRPWSSGSIDGRRRRGPRPRLRGDDRAQRGQARRGGPGHRLHLLRLQGPPAGRGPVAPHGGAARASSTTRRPTTLERRRRRAVACSGCSWPTTPRLAAACTTALLGSGPRGVRAARPLRRRAAPPAGRRPGRRRPTPRVLQGLDLAWSGAMLWAGHGPHPLRRRARRPGRASPGCCSRERDDADAGGPPTATGDRRPLHYSPYDYEIHEDPYPTYARLRAEAPLYRNDELDFWALSRHEDVLAAFRNPAQLSNRFGVSLDPAAYGPDAHRAMSFLAMDPPRHTRMRSLVSKAFTPRRVAELEDRVRAIAARAHRGGARARQLRLRGRLRRALPMDVISEMIGVPRADRAELRRLADLLVHREEGLNDVPREGIEAALTLAGYFADMVTDRRAARADDLTSALLDADIDGDRLTDDEVISLPLPHDGGRQRDHHQAAGQRLVLGVAVPRRAGQGARPTRPACPTGWRRRCASTPPPRCCCGSPPARSSSAAPCSPTARGCCCWWARPTATRRVFEDARPLRPRPRHRPS